jgi:hypothetical protein
MSEERLTPELQSLLAAEKETSGPDAGARDRVARRLAQTLGVTLAAAGASSAATSGAQAVLPKAVVGKSLAAKLLVAAVIGGVGAGGVITTVTLMHRHAARNAEHRATAPAVAPPTPAPPMPAPPRVAPPSPPVAAPGSPSASTTAPSLAAPAASPPMETTAPSRAEPHRAARHGDLAAERALLAEARAAMQSSDAARALALLDDHARRFAHGQLAEERDAMRVPALWLSGDRDGARRHADDFARRHPDSLFLPSVERAVTEPTQ